MKTCPVREEGILFGPIIVPGTTAANTTSQVIDAKELVVMALHFITTGTITGTWALQASNDYDPRDPGTTPTWTALTDTDTTTMLAAVATAVSTGNSGSYFADGIPTGARAYRVVYTHGSGTGTIGVNVGAKE